MDVQNILRNHRNTLSCQVIHHKLRIAFPTFMVVKPAMTWPHQNLGLHGFTPGIKRTFVEQRFHGIGSITP